jgi:type II secretory pathway pseudopilin PulG
MAEVETEERMRIRIAQRTQDAATMVETLMAVCILAITAASIISGINYGFFRMRLARENLRATQVMLERLEVVRLYNWEQVTNGTYIPRTFAEPYDPSMPTNSRGVIYYGTLTIANPAFSASTPSYAGNMRQLTIQLTWTNNNSLPHTRSLTTYIAKDGVQNYVY